MKLYLTSGIILMLLLTSCASTSDIKRLENSISYLSRSLRVIEGKLSSQFEGEIEKIYENQKTINSNVSSIQKDTENEFLRQKEIIFSHENTIASVLEKTDQFEVSHNEGAVFLMPSEKEPDLTVISVQVPSSVLAGDAINVVIKVKNIGDAEVDKGFVTGYYLSTNSTITTSDRKVKNCSHEKKSVGETGTCDFNVTIPSDILDGTYYFGAIVDEDRVIDESDNSNNTGHASNTIKISQKP